jgi:hypothetical protein
LPSKRLEGFGHPSPVAWILYFVVGDEIIIVDRNHKIVAVLAV